MIRLTRRCRRNRPGDLAWLSHSRCSRLVLRKKMRSLCSSMICGSGVCVMPAVGSKHEVSTSCKHDRKVSISSGALIISYTILGVTYYRCSIVCLEYYRPRVSGGHYYQSRADATVLFPSQCAASPLLLYGSMLWAYVKTDTLNPKATLHAQGPKLTLPYRGDLSTLSPGLGDFERLHPPQSRRP